MVAKTTANTNNETTLCYSLEKHAILFFEYEFFSMDLVIARSCNLLEVHNVKALPGNKIMVSTLLLSDFKMERN